MHYRIQIFFVPHNAGGTLYPGLTVISIDTIDKFWKFFFTSFDCPTVNFGPFSKGQPQ